MKRCLILVVFIFLLAACSRIPVLENTNVSSSPPAPGNSQSATENSHADAVEVSSPTASLPPDLESPTSEAISEETISIPVTGLTSPTVDASKVEMPAGIPLYPGATGLQVPTGSAPSGMGVNYVVFFTTDSSEKLITFYKEKASGAGFSFSSSDSAANASGIQSTLWRKGSGFLILQDWQPVNGEMKVQISWTGVK